MRYYLFNYFFTCPGKMGFGPIRVKAPFFPSNKQVQDFAKDIILKPKDGFAPLASREEISVSVLGFTEFNNKEDFENFCKDDNFKYYE